MKPQRPTSRNPPSSEPAGTVSAMRLRVILSSEQARKASGWIYATHAFRNAAVAFLIDRRLARNRGVARYPVLLERAMAARGHLLLYAGPFDPTTQTCPACGVVNTALKGAQALNIRHWDCPSCHTPHGRDQAAADNIQEFALQRFLEFFTGAESVPGNRPLHPELAAFIARGGMTAFQRGHSRECRQVRKGLGLEMPGNRESTPAPAGPVRNRHSG